MSNRTRLPITGSSPGFTLLETLLAMALTAVVGSVLFKTWELVMTSGRDMRSVVQYREPRRIAFAIVDNDLSCVTLGDRNSSLPLPGRQPIVPDDDFYSRTNRERPDDESQDTVLLSFATTASALPEGSRLGSVFCVEYVLRGSGHGTLSFVRRERGMCGVSGMFPWTETVLWRNVDSAAVQFVMQNGEIQEEWTSGQRIAPREIRLLIREYGSQEQQVLAVPMFSRRIDIAASQK